MQCLIGAKRDSCCAELLRAERVFFRAGLFVAVVSVLCFGQVAGAEPNIETSPGTEAPPETLPEQPSADSPLAQEGDIIWSSTLMEPGISSDGAVPADLTRKQESSGLDESDHHSASTGNILGILGRTALVLAGVCLLAYVLLKWGVGRLFGRDSGEESMIELVERRSIGPDAAVAVIDIDTRRFVVGESKAGLRKLGELDQPVPDRWTDEHGRFDVVAFEQEVLDSVLDQQED